MVGSGSDTIAGFRVRKFMCPACRHQRRIPSAKELERLQSDSLSCQNCKAVENFYVKSKLDGCKEYACRRCGFSFHIRPNTQYPKLEQKNCINRKKENVKNPPFWTESLSGSNIEKRESSKILKQKTSGLLDKFLREGD